MEEKLYSVSEAVRLIGVESHVLRYWEEELRIPIQRTSQGHRVYSEENIETFRQVRAWKQKGIQLKAIRLLLGEKSGLEQALYTVAYGEAETVPGAGEAGKIRAEETGSTSGNTSECGAGSVSEHGTDNAAERSTDNAAERSTDNAAEQRTEQEAAYEIIQVEETQDDMEKGIQLLKQMMEEVVGEQNRKLEQQLIEQLREELELLYLQYIQTMEETAVSREKSRRGIRRIFDRLFPGKA